jgi:hypothetical protein
MAIADAMICRERCHERGTRDNLAIDAPGALYHLAKANQRDLRWIDDSINSLDTQFA